MELPRVAIVIPCRNERDRIRECLESLLAGDYPPALLDIVAVDGASDDGTRELLQDYAQQNHNIRLLMNEDRIVPVALNKAIAATSASVVMRLDAHALYPRNYVSTLVRWLFASDAHNVGVPCQTVPGADTAMARAIAAALAHPFGVGNSRFRIGVTHPQWVDTVPFGCFRRQVFERLGGFDEELVRNQDDEFNCRIRQAGGKILLVPSPVVKYYSRTTLRALAQMYYQYGKFKPLVIRKRRIVATARQLAPPTFVTLLGFSALLSPWWVPMQVTLAVIAGVYVTAAVGVAATAVPQWGLVVALRIPLVCAVMHLTYGIGFLHGVLSLLRRRDARERAPGHHVLSPQSDQAERTRIAAVYASRSKSDDRYRWTNRAHVFIMHDLERRVLDTLQQFGVGVSTQNILEVGCGEGYWIRQVVKWGAAPGRVTGLDLLEDRVRRAQSLSPPASLLLCASVTALPLPAATYDLVMQFTLFSSILDPAAKRAAASEMLRVLRPQGTIVWYDLAVNNPRNANVRGLSRAEILHLFAGCDIWVRRVTLAPPLVRAVAPYSYTACTLLNGVPFLRTHLLAVIRPRT